MATYYGYARVSTKEQSDYSIDDQLKFLARKATEAALPFQPFPEKDSGNKLAEERTLLWEVIIPRLEAGDILGVFDYSRLSRKGASEARRIADEILKRGARVQINGVYYDPSDPDSDFLFDIHSTIAKYYLAIQRKKSLTGIRQKKENGEWVFTGRLYGYDIEHHASSRKTIRINQNESEIVRKLFSKYIAGSSINALTTYLNRNNIKTKTGKQFVPRTVQRIILNPIYAGYYLINPPIIGGKRVNLGRKGLTINDLVKSNMYPPIISLDDYLKCLGSYREVRRTRGRTMAYRWRGYLLTGLVTCENCQDKGVRNVYVHGWSRPLNSKTLNSVYTSRVHVSNCGCQFKTLREDVFNELVRMSFVYFFSDQNRLAAFVSEKVRAFQAEIQKDNETIIQISKEIDSLDAKISKAEEALDKIITQDLELNVQDTTPQERNSYLRLIKSFEEKKKNLQEQRLLAISNSRFINAEIENGATLGNIIEEYQERITHEYGEDAIVEFSSVDTGSRRNILMRYIDTINVKNSSFIIHFIDGLSIDFALEKNRGRNIQRVFRGRVTGNESIDHEIEVDTTVPSISLIYDKTNKWKHNGEANITSELQRLLLLSKKSFVTSQQETTPGQ